MADLSAHDKAILNCIFNPNLPVEEAYEEADVDHLKDAEETEESESAQLIEVKKRELQAVQEAEGKHYEEALKIFKECLEVCPEKASLYNNRAQVLQFTGHLAEAIDDLTKAINLAERTSQNKTLCHALCQRGLLRRKFNNLELARGDFERAATFGSKFAKNQLVEINPYAALCNQMLKKVMEEYK